MAQPILSVPNEKLEAKSTINLLPCQIHHDGPVDPVKPFWQYTRLKDGNPTSFFRGRKLTGKVLNLPETHCGVVAQLQKDDPNAKTSEEETADLIEIEQGALGGTGKLQVNSEFNEMILWSHEALADAECDPYVRSIEEWVQLANSIHACPDEAQLKT